MKPTILDVAAHAGVSKSTVSLVLQDSPLVKAATRAKVTQAMADIGYVYNAAAAGLRGGHLRLGTSLEAAPVAALNIDRNSAPNTAPIVALSVDLSDPSGAAFAGAVQTAAAAKGMQLHILSFASAHPGRKITTRFSEASAHDCIFALHPMADARLQDGLAATAATRHLLGLGGGQVAFVGGHENHPITAHRLRGYTQRMARAQAAPLIITGGDDFSFGKRSLARMLADYPDYKAALCHSDQVALGMIEGLRERGIALGDGFRVVGWGDTPPAAVYGLSSIKPNLALLADACITWVQNGGETNHEIPQTLVRRLSSMGGA
jgi:LacI family transcriptional regulator